MQTEPAHSQPDGPRGHQHHLLAGGQQARNRPYKRLDAFQRQCSIRCGDRAGTNLDDDARRRFEKSFALRFQFRIVNSHRMVPMAFSRLKCEQPCLPLLAIRNDAAAGQELQSWSHSQMLPETCEASGAPASAPGMLCRWLYMPPVRINWSCVPCSSITPPFKTMMRSTHLSAEMRWETNTIV